MSKRKSSSSSSDEISEEKDFNIKRSKKSNSSNNSNLETKKFRGIRTDSSISEEEENQYNDDFNKEVESKDSESDNPLVLAKKISFGSRVRYGMSSPSKSAVVSKKNEQILLDESRHKDFFKSIFKAYEVAQYKINFIVVVHILPTLPVFLNALKDLGNIALIIPKSSAQDEKMKAQIERDFGDKLLKNETGESTKERLKNSDYLLSIFKEIEGEITIIDIGGYFAQPLEIMERNSELRKEAKRIKAIIEDTENGHQKYIGQLNNAEKLGIPILSVARSNLKRNEDFNVGKSLVRAVDKDFREFHLIPEQIQTSAVIGFGKIGQSIAYHLREMNIGKVIVYDHNPTLSMYAASLGYHIADKQTILAEASLVFCATGNKALSDIDFSNFKREEVFIASCTSPEDEFDFTETYSSVKNLDEEPEYSEMLKCHELYRFGKKNIWLLRKGRASNFFHNAVLGDSIRGVQAALLVGVIKLIDPKLRESLLEYKKSHSKKSELIEISGSDEIRISKLWIHNYRKVQIGLMQNMPQSAIDVIGRQEEIFVIKKILDEKNLVNVFGEPGVGKTELILKYFESFKNIYDLIWFFDFEEGIEVEYRELARNLQISTIGNDYDAIMKKVHEKIVISQKSYVFIFENAKLGNVTSLEKIVLTLQRERNFTYDFIRNHIVVISQKKLNVPSYDSLEVKAFSDEDYKSFYGSSILRNIPSSPFNGLDLAIRNPLILSLISGFSRLTSEDKDEEFIQELSKNNENKLQFVISKLLMVIKEAFPWCIKILFFNCFLYGRDIDSNLSVLFLKHYSEDDKPGLDAVQMIKISLNLLSKANLIIKLRNDNRNFSIHSHLQRSILDNFNTVNHLNTSDNKQFLIYLKIVITVILYNLQYSSYFENKFDFYHKNERSKPTKYYLLHARHIAENFISKRIEDKMLESKEKKEIKTLEKLPALCVVILIKLGAFYLNEERNYVDSYKFYDTADSILKNYKLTGQKDFVEEEIFTIHGRSVNKSILSRHQNPNLLAEEEKNAEGALNILLESDTKLREILELQIYIHLAYINKYRYEYLMRETHNVLRKSKDHSEIYLAETETDIRSISNYMEEAKKLLETIRNNISKAKEILQKETPAKLGITKKIADSKQINTDSRFYVVTSLFYHLNANVNLLSTSRELSKKNRSDLEEAIKSVKESITRREALSTNHPDLARSYYLCAKILEKCSEYDGSKYLDQAHEQIKKALSIQRTVLPTGHKNLEESLLLKKQIEEKITLTKSPGELKVSSNSSSSFSSSSSLMPPLSAIQSLTPHMRQSSY